MRNILVTQHLFENSSYPETREGLDINWSKFLFSCGFFPIPISIKLSPDLYFDKFKPAGILLTGGNDLSRFSPDNSLSKMRDQLEIKIIRLALTHKLPILGVCRGMQILANYFEFPIEALSGHVGKEHSISVDEKTKLGQFLAPDLKVNSYHNYCIKAVKGPFKVSAKCPKDKSIEAFESETYKICALMWHPEREKPFNEAVINLIREFFLGSWLANGF